MAEQVGASKWLRSREKRLYDVATSIASLPFAVPVVALSALAVAIRDRQNPFFVQRRLGKDNELIPVYKIRTLRGTADYGGIGQGPNDSRSTSIGRFLRKYSIDELPQLFNVLKGDMSVVGPRAISQAEDARMAESLPPEDYAQWRQAYGAARPGLVSRYAIETRNAPQTYRDTADFYRQRAQLDQEYIAEATRRHDLQLCLGVVGAARTVLKPQGYEPQQLPLGQQA